MTEQGHGGLAVSKALKALGVDHLFTLTGGHIFPILDGCHQDGIRIVDTRHEQSAAFAAEGWARMTRSLGACAITAGPGVTNAMSPLAQARFNGAPVLALGGRAPAFRWGQGSLQEIDHVPFVDPIAPSKTVSDTTRVAAEVLEAARAALTPPRGPRFLDFPLDVLFNSVDFEVPATREVEVARPDDDGVRAVADLVAGAERPVVIAGANVWLDFRLGFGQSFASNTKVVHLDSHPDLIASHVELAASIGARLDGTFDSLARAAETPADSKPWVERLTRLEEEKRDQVQAELRSDARPIHPMRIYGELVPLLDRDAVVIGDGGDFVSYAGREIPSFAGGCW